MSEQRFIVESVEIISDCNDKKKRIAKVITDTDELYSYEDLYEIKDLLNEQQSLITALEKDHKRQENQIKLLNKQLSKIPPKIREVWLYD